MLTLVLIVLGRSALAGAIHDAAATGNLDKIKVLMAGSPGLVNTTDAYGMTALHWAVQAGHWEVADFLLANKADANLRNKFGAMPLHLAVKAGHPDAVELLLAHGVEVNAKDYTGKTPLDLVTDPNRKKGLVDLLRKHGGKLSGELP